MELSRCDILSILCYSWKRILLIVFDVFEVYLLRLSSTESHSSENMIPSKLSSWATVLECLLWLHFLRDMIRRQKINRMFLFIDRSEYCNPLNQVLLCILHHKREYWRLYDKEKHYMISIDFSLSLFKRSVNEKHPLR